MWRVFFAPKGSLHSRLVNVPLRPLSPRVLIACHGPERRRHLPPDRPHLGAPHPAHHVHHVGGVVPHRVEGGPAEGQELEDGGGLAGVHRGVRKVAKFVKRRCCCVRRGFHPPELRAEAKKPHCPCLIKFCNFEAKVGANNMFEQKNLCIPNIMQDKISWDEGSHFVFSLM